MLKKSLLISAIALSALVSNTFAQATASLDVIIRSFLAAEYGFEMFDFAREGAGVCAGSNPDRQNSKATAANRICFTNDGRYVACSEGGTTLKYGQPNCNNETRGYVNGPDKIDYYYSNGVKTNTTAVYDNGGAGCWGNDVYVTRGMVKEDLNYSKCSDSEKEGSTQAERAINGRYCAYPEPDNGDCYGENLNEWYTDNSKARRIDYEMILNREGNSGNTYSIDYNYNTSTDWGRGHSTHGYFPLDAFIESGQVYPPGTLDVWCPYNIKDQDKAYGSNYEWSDADNIRYCRIWGKNGGEYYKDPTQATRAVSEGVPDKLLHVYSFTMAGSGEFKYVKGADDIFEFIGDDDMWIFIDGKLVADLGGTHLAAPAKLNIKQYGEDMGWEDGSKHAINFFYAERQSDGSNMKLRMSLSDLTPARFGAPYIMKSETVQYTNGTRKILVWVSTELDQGKIEEFIGSNQYPIIIHNSGNRDILAFKLTSISSPERDGANGYIYEIDGQVCRSTGICDSSYPLNNGDSLSFNVKNGEDISEGKGDGRGNFDDKAGYGLSDEYWYIKSKGGTAATTKRWARNTTSMPPVDATPIPADPDPKKPEFDMDTWFTGNAGSDNGAIPGGNFDNSLSSNSVVGGSIASSSPNDVVHGFGEKGVTIPSSRAGELILTVYPNAGNDVCINGTCMSYAEWDTSEYKKNFGLPPEAENGNVFGVLDPTEEQKYGGYAFVKNGFSNENSVNNGGIQVAPTRCTSQGNEDKPEINCLSFSFPAKQPFQVAVTVFDQLGNFVTQYREAVSVEEFRQIVQTPTFTDPTAKDIAEADGCKYPTSADQFGDADILTTNGMVMVNVNIYPFSTNGRRFGNGVYILKIDRVDIPYVGCMNSNNSAIQIDEGFVRYHSDTKFGWLRAGSK